MPAKSKSVSFEDLDELKSNQVDLTLLPEKFVGTITEAEIKDDRQKNRCLFVNLSLDPSVSVDGQKGETDENGEEKPRLVIQKFTSTIVGEFKDKLASLGYDSIPIGEPLEWESEKLGRSQNPRWFPSGKAKVSAK